MCFRPRRYLDSTALTNILMPALAASSLYATALARRVPTWKAAHVLAFLALGLLSASGPYLYNPSYVKFASAALGSVVWTLEPPLYPAKIELSNITYRVDSERVPVEDCGPVPRAVVAVLDVAVDGVWTKVEVRYGIEEALGLRAPLGLALAGDYLWWQGPHTARTALRLFQPCTGTRRVVAWAAEERPPGTTWLGSGPSPFSES